MLQITDFFLRTLKTIHCQQILLKELKKEITMVEFQQTIKTKRNS